VGLCCGERVGHGSRAMETRLMGDVNAINR
jgi:hypothetical protein